MKPTPQQSLEALAGILQQISLPAVAPEGQLSHSIIAQHLDVLARALEKDEESKET